MSDFFGGDTKEASKKELELMSTNLGEMRGQVRHAAQHERILAAVPRAAV